MKILQDLSLRMDPTWLVWLMLSSAASAVQAHPGSTQGSPALWAGSCQSPMPAHADMNQINTRPDRYQVKYCLPEYLN